MRGVELEVGAAPGKVFKITGKPEIINLGGKKIKIQNIKLENTKGLKEPQIQSGLKKF